MRVAVVSVTVLCVLLLAGCQSDGALAPTENGTGTATPERTETPDASATTVPAQTATATPAPTATPLPPATPSGLWAFDLGRGKQALLYEGDGEVTSQIEASGNVVTVLVTDAEGATASRFRSNGDLIESHDGRGMVVSSANGEHRFYLDLADPAAPALVLEHQGEVVRLEGTRPRLGVSFSPAGDRLLAVSERPGLVAEEVVRTFSVHETTAGRLRMQFEHRALLGSSPVALWSPSGRYVADEGIEGLFVRDTVSGQAWRLGPGGSARWSPLGDRLLAISELGELSIVNIPELDRVDLGGVEGRASVLFDRSGQLAVVTTYADPEGRTGPVTRAFAAEAGVEVASWDGMDTADSSVRGLDPVIALGDGVAAVFSSVSCLDGFVVHHPALGDDGRCLAGANPRWSPRGDFLVYVRDRQLVVLSVSSDSEQVIVRGTPAVSEGGGPVLTWSPDGSWLLIEWTNRPEASESP